MIHYEFLGLAVKYDSNSLCLSAAVVKRAVWNGFVHS